jgi:hypothetical protein
MAQIICSRHEIAHVGREVGVGELALATANAGEVEAQNGDVTSYRPSAIRDAAKISLPQVKQ